MVVFAFISNTNRSIYEIIDLIRPDDELTEITFSGRQSTENEHCETLKKLAHILNFQN